MALNLPNGPLKTRDANSVPTCPLADYLDHSEVPEYEIYE